MNARTRREEIKDRCTSPERRKTSIKSILKDKKTKRRQILDESIPKKLIAMYPKSVTICATYDITLLPMVNIRGTDSEQLNENNKMHSAGLQKIFQPIYKKFFNIHDIVLSANSVLSWGADISHGISSLRIKQKLPLKTYCGVNMNTSGKTTFGIVSYYSTFEKTFKEEEFSVFFKYNNEKITLFIHDFLIRNGYTGGMNIDFLIETPPGHGCASSGTISVVLTFLLHIIVSKLDPKIIVDGTLTKDHPLFDELYTWSIELSRCISEGKTTGASNYAIMIPNATLPVVCLSKNSVQADTIAVSSGIFSENNISHNTVFYTDTMEHFLGIQDSTIRELPLDYGIIFTGIEHNMFSEMESKKELAKKANEQLSTFASTIIESLPLQTEDQVAISDLIHEYENEISHKHIDSTNFKILNAFHQLLVNKYDDAGINGFIDTIRNIGFMSFSYQKSSKLFFSLQHLFYKYQQFEDEEIAILPFNTGKIGGSFLFVMKPGKSRTTIQKVLDHLQDDGHIVILDHASWRDGTVSTGVSIDQYIGKKIYSSYTKEGDIIFTDSFGASYCANYEMVISNENKCILLDTIGGRIYVKGIKLTSKEIHSQNTTIDMLKILIENIGIEVSNSKLPVSTYSQNKNELLSKVVLPIKKIAKEIFGIEISLTCSGGITDYFLRLEKDESIRIGIIKKLQN